MTYQEAIESLGSLGETNASVMLAKEIRNALTCARVHVIPVGGDEPVHYANGGCWCFPLSESDGRMFTHNARDMREKYERQNAPVKNGGWVLIFQGLPPAE